MNKKKYNKGITLVEMLVTLGILGLLVVTVSTFQKDVFSLNYSLQGSLNAQLDARHVVKVMITELREMGPSALGAYPIALASSTGITFYSDVNNDGMRDRVRYFLSGNTVKKGVVSPSGSPLTYNDSNEKLITVISGFVASSTRPLFKYYPAEYDGTTAPLSFPVDIQVVRLIGVNVIIDADPLRSPAPIIVGSEVNIRNLKENL